MNSDSREPSLHCWLVWVLLFTAIWMSLLITFAVLIILFRSGFCSLVSARALTLVDRRQFNFGLRALAALFVCSPGTLSTHSSSQNGTRLCLSTTAHFNLGSVSIGYCAPTCHQSVGDENQEFTSTASHTQDFVTIAAAKACSLTEHK